MTETVNKLMSSNQNDFKKMKKNNDKLYSVKNEIWETQEKCHNEKIKTLSNQVCLLKKKNEKLADENDYLENKYEKLQTKYKAKVSALKLAKKEVRDTVDKYQKILSESKSQVKHGKTRR